MLPMEGHKETLACLVEQNIHETHTSILVLNLRAILQLSGWCSTLHATEWIIDFLPTWEILLPVYHPKSLSPNICQKKVPPRGKPQNHSTKTDEWVSNCFSRGEIILDCSKCKQRSRSIVLVHYRHIMNSSVYTRDTEDTWCVFRDNYTATHKRS